MGCALAPFPSGSSIMIRNTTNATVSGCTLHAGPLPAGVLTTIGTSAGALTTTGTPSVSSSANQTRSLPNVSPLAVGQNSNHKSSLSRGAAAGIGVAVTTLVLALILAAFCFLRRRSRRAYLLEENTVIGSPTPETRLYGSMHEQRKGLTGDSGYVRTESDQLVTEHPVESPWMAQLSDQPLRTADEYTGFLSKFAQEHLHRFYDLNDETAQNVARQAALEGARKINVPQELMPGLAKLALYDFIILCGTCNVMTSSEKRCHFIQVDLIEV
jgi:hypothetical protein